MEETVYVGVDVGGTKICAGLVDRTGTLTERLHRKTPDRADRPDVIEAIIVGAVQELAATTHVAAVGVGAAGFVGVGGVVRFAPHVSWRDEPLQERLAARLGLPVVVDNDANATALAELRFGAARGARQALCITLGTGIGGAIVLDGQVRRGAQGLAGEFGHMQVVDGGQDCPCGLRGCWEQYCSVTALTRAARSHGAPADVSGADVAVAARRGERWAVAAFGEVAYWLGVGVAGLCSAFDPEVVVVGGGLSRAGTLLLAPARTTLSDRLPGREWRPLPRLVAASGGAEAGCVGAAWLARETFST